MKVGVFIPNGCPLSMRIYAEAIMSRLVHEGFSFEVFKRNQPIPEAIDLYWDPRSGGGQNPYRLLRGVKQPLVVTVHGMALFSVPMSELYSKGKERILAKKNKLKYRYGWKRMRSTVSKIITVSHHSKSEVLEYLSFKDQDVVPIWNGYDASLFNKGTKTPSVNNGKPYFFTVVSYQKKKNFERMVEAYEQIPESDDKPDFIAVVKPYHKKPKIKGLKIINHSLDIEEIIMYYRNALALVFTTLHEGFGLPIIEAMACGCPVITSNDTACKEVAGKAALTVDPRSVSEIKNAMLQMMDTAIRNPLYPLMDERLEHFGWDISAAEHQKVFEQLVK
ncbi:MAG: glycosyltransferase family 4 protein [Bacteroidetes bacterium]|nr:glycosyltransferase family 4 protein [Bacteroidota bacterium]